MSDPTTNPNYEYGCGSAFIAVTLVGSLYLLIGVALVALAMWLLGVL